MADVVLPNTITAGTEMVAAQVQGNDEALRDGINAQLVAKAMGVANVVWPGGDDEAALTVAHGVADGLVPLVIAQAQSQSSIGKVVTAIDSVTTSQFTVRVYSPSGFTPAAGTITPVAWWAFGNR